jgi:hypothetical protein
MLASIGIERSKPFQPDAATRRILDRAAETGYKIKVGDLDDETAQFLLNRLWTSHRPDAGGDGGPSGYPFTGTGWSYDWDPLSASRIGVSEYVVKRGAQIREPKIATPRRVLKCNLIGATFDLVEASLFSSNL